VKLTDAQALLFWQQYDYWLNVEGATEEKSQEYAWEDVRRESPELRPARITSQKVARIPTSPRLILGTLASKVG
jgi:hypothetical protein